jgi:hypothetical protein
MLGEAYLVPYGGFVAADLQPGEIVVVNGATGAFGSAGWPSRWRWALAASSPPVATRTRSTIWHAASARACGR